MLLLRRAERVADGRQLRLGGGQLRAQRRGARPLDEGSDGSSKQECDKKNKGT